MVLKIYVHSQETGCTLEQMPTRIKHTQMDDEGENYHDPQVPPKGTIPFNYRPMLCLRMMWKMLTALIRGKFYCSLACRRLFTEEQKRCRMGTGGINHLLCRDQHILKETKTRQKNVVMVLINCKRAYDMAYDMVSQTKITVSENVQNILQKDKRHHECHGKLQRGNWLREVKP